jgi:hypothetical protein
MTVKELLSRPDLTLEMLQDDLRIETREDLIYVANYVLKEIEKIGAIFDKAIAQCELDENKIFKTK